MFLAEPEGYDKGLIMGVLSVRVIIAIHRTGRGVMVNVGGIQHEELHNAHGHGTEHLARTRIRQTVQYSAYRIIIKFLGGDRSLSASQRGSQRLPVDPLMNPLRCGPRPAKWACMIACTP